MVSVGVINGSLGKPAGDEFYPPRAMSRRVFGRRFILDFGHAPEEQLPRVGRNPAIGSGSAEREREREWAEPFKSSVTRPGKNLKTKAAALAFR